MNSIVAQFIGAMREQGIIPVEPIANKLAAGEPGMSTWHLYMVQQELAASDWRENAQANDWVGYLVARVAGLSAETDKARIKAIIQIWKRNGALAVERRIVNGRETPFVIVGKPVDVSEIVPPPHLQKCGAASAESADVCPTLEPLRTTRTSL